MIHTRTGRIVAVAIAVCIAVLLLFIRGAYAPLTPSGGFTREGEFPSANERAIFGPRYGSWSGSDAHTGTIISAPFTVGAGVDYFVSGYPSHAGQSLRFERIDGGGSFVPPFADPGETWKHVTYSVPLSWVGKSVRLVASDSAAGMQAWVGVADVRSASLISVLLNDTRMKLFLLTLCGCLAFLPALGLARRLCRRTGLPDEFLFAAVLIVLGIVAELDFFLTMINTTATQIMLILATVAACVLTVRDLRAPGTLAELRRSGAWIPFAVTVFATMLYVAVVDLTIRANAPPSLIALFSLPSDNNLPHLLAEHIANHAPPKPFFADWLSSDRPPLQAGFDLFTRLFAPVVKDDYMRYQGLAQVLQTSCLGMLYLICRACGLGARRALGVTALALLSGFFFVNSVFVWPKLLSASYLAIAVATVFAPLRRSRAQAILVGVAVALALLSHGGVAFTLPALAIAWIVRDRIAGARLLATACVAAVVLLLPWMWYQRAYDPPGDRLLKWHLAGQMNVTPEPFAQTLTDAYAVPFSTIVTNKADNVLPLVSYDGRTADKEFFSVRYALGALMLPFLAAFILMRQRRFRVAGSLACIALGSLAFWCLLMYGPGTTVVHQGSYLTIVLMFIAGGFVATAWPALFALCAAWQLYDFIATWLSTFSAPEFFTAGGLATLAGCLIVAAPIALAFRSAGTLDTTP